MANRMSPEQLDEIINQKLAKKLFWEFCLHYDYDFFTRRQFLKEVADAYQVLIDNYRTGKAIRVSVSMPPRSGKSYITSLFCAFFLAQFPELCIMRNSCTATLFKKLSRQVRTIIKSLKYKTIFPEIRLSEDNQAIESWALINSKQGAYFGGGVDGTIIGSGANLSINDDLYRGLKDAMSPTYNEKVIEWKESAADSRKEKGCAEIFVGTRWTKNDIIGRAKEKERIDIDVTVAAMTEDGKSFCEDVHTTEEYEEIKNDVDEVIWEGEYMQSPIELKGLLFPLSGLQFYNPATVDVNKLSVFRLGVIDPANQGGDDLSFPAGYLVQDKIYIHDVIYNNDGTDINEPAAVAFIKNNKLNGVRFEGNSAWYLLGQNIRKKLQADKSNCVFRIINNTENKHTRILAQAAFIRNHFIFRADWEKIPAYKKFMKNLISYMLCGGNDHDDAPDSCAELAKYFQEHFKNLW